MKAESKKKLQVLMIILGVTILICLIFRYILPLAAPFVVALIVAALIDRPVGFLTRKLHIKRVISVIIMLLVVTGVIGTLVFFLGKTLFNQAERFISNIDVYMDNINKVLCGYCSDMDCCFKLKAGTSFNFVSEHLEKTVDGISGTIASNLMNSSWNIVAAFTVFFTTLTFIIMATIFISRDMEKIRMYTKISVFRDELRFITGKLKNILGTYLRTQLIIMTLTSIISAVGLYCTKNPYAILLGVLIGIVDAFPILGTGTVYIPWAIILVILGRYKMAAIIFVIYIVCYYVRQFLEPRLMGDPMGISPIVMLISLYVGLMLFGISGVITGPIAAILIKEISVELIDKL